MSHETSRLSRSAALSVLAGGAAAAALPARALAQAAGTPVRMGAMPLDASGEAYYGADAGIWQANGIAATITTSQSGQAIIQGVVTGDLDVGLGAPLNIMTAIARNIPLVMIAPAVIYSAKDANPNLVVAKDGPIKVPKDLVGATFGVSTLADLNQMSLLNWLDKNNVPREGVKFVEMKFGELGLALQKNLVQAAILTEPFKTDAMRAGQIRDFSDTYLSIAPEISPFVWFSTKAWVQKNPDLAKRLVKAIYATAAYANTHQKETGDSLARVAKMDPAVVANMKRLIFATSNERRYTEPLLTLAVKYNMVTRPISFAEFSPPI